MTVVRLTQRDRFLMNVLVDAATGCWLWQRELDPQGYARVTWNRTPGRLAHRVAYEEFVAPIPAGFVIDHLCRTPSCVNPQHLEVVTQAENVRRGDAKKRRTHCPAGHPYDAENTYIRPYDWAQICRTCRAECRRRYNERRAAA